MAKGQVSTELLIIVGVVLLVFIPLLVMVYFKSAEANDQIAAYQAELTVFRLAYMANSVGTLGEGSSVFTEVYIPPGAQALEIKKSGNGGEVVLAIQSGGQTTEVVEIIRTRLSNEITITKPQKGWARFKLTNVLNAQGEGEVYIQRVY